MQLVDVGAVAAAEGVGKDTQLRLLPPQQQG